MAGVPGVLDEQGQSSSTLAKRRVRVPGMTKVVAQGRDVGRQERGRKKEGGFKRWE